jgi:hypothetical protein
MEDDEFDTEYPVTAILIVLVGLGLTAVSVLYAAVSFIQWVVA